MLINDSQLEKAAEDLKNITLSIGDPLAEFSRKVYPEKFQEFADKYKTEFSELISFYEAQKEDDTIFDKIGDLFAEKMAAELESETKKSKQEVKLMGYNMALVSYVFPAIRMRTDEYKQSADAFTVQLIASWKKKFPKTNLQAVDVAEIEAGFRQRRCYITTAICDSLQKGDDCYELQCLRDFRDQYLLTTPEGEAAVYTYYDLAPTIVKRINRRTDAADIYQNIYDQYLTNCIHLIEQDKKEECSALYEKMVYDLKEEYFLQ